jgi:hypothetical protein
LGRITRNNEPNLSEEALNKIIYEHLNIYKPRNGKSEVKKRWTNKTLFKKSFHEYNNEIGMFTAIYPFHGNELSGWTDIISISLTHDDENGFGIDVCLLGFHLYAHSKDLEKAFLKLIGFNRPKWPKGMKWEEYSIIKKAWIKKHPIYHFFDIDWRYEIGLNRVKGLFFTPEVDGYYSPKKEICLNILRNKVWNLI